MRRPTRIRRHGMRAFAVWLALGAGAVAAADPLSRARACTWSRPPNYRYSIDPADVVQLTDGQRAANDYIWIDRASVGWELQMGDIVTWTLDLGQAADLDSVVVQSAWFERSEIVPPSLLCAVADQPDRFQWAGAFDASTLARPDSTWPARVALAVPLHAARGRWVLIAALLRSNFLCTDEVEIHGKAARAGTARGAASAPAAARPHAPAPAPGAAGSPIARAFAPAEIDAVYALQRRLWAMRAALPPLDAALPGAAEEDVRLAARARSWRSAGAPPLLVRRVDPWTPTTPWSAPQAEIGDTLELWPGAWAAAAIEIASAADSSVRAELRLAAAGSGAPRSVLREVVHVESRDGRWSGDALPLAPPTLVLSPGRVQQVWIDVDAHGAAPGLHRLQIEAGGRIVLLPVRVHDVLLPASPLAALDWTYPSKFALTRTLPEIVMRDNRAHGIDTWCLAEESVPWPDPATIDTRGHLTSPLDFTACDRDLALLAASEVRRIVWYWDFDAQADDPSRGRFRHPYLSAAWRRAVSEWLDAWLGHLESLGYDRNVMQPVDEASSRAVHRLYHSLRELRPGLPLGLTLIRDATPRELRALEPHLTLAIVERRALDKNSQWIARARRRGIEVWTYAVPWPPKSTPPVSGYRLLPWEAWTRGLGGCGFWAYGDTGLHSADAWNDFDGARADFAVVYGEIGAPRSLRGEALVPSKRWQAFRIGLDDTALLAAALRRTPGLRASARAALDRDRLDPDAERRRLLRLLE